MSSLIRPCSQQSSRIAHGRQGIRGKEFMSTFNYSIGDFTSNGIKINLETWVTEWGGIGILHYDRYINIRGVNRDGTLFERGWVFGYQRNHNEGEVDSFLAEKGFSGFRTLVSSIERSNAPTSSYQARRYLTRNHG